MENNIIVFTVALPLTPNYLMTLVFSVVLAGSVLAAVLKIADNGLSVQSMKPVLPLLLISLLALLMIIICHVIRA